MKSVLNIIDIGTNYGKDIKNYPKDSNIWAFEPNPIPFNHLLNNFKEYKGLKLYRKAVADFNGLCDLNITDDTYSSSLLNLKSEYVDDSVLKFTRKIKVDTIRLDKFIQDEKIKEIDFYKSDTQGYDLKILKSLGDSVKIIKKGRIEVVNKNKQIYENQDNTLENVVEYLTFYNFKFLNLSKVEAIFQNSEVFDYDLIFVKDGEII